MSPIMPAVEEFSNLCSVIYGYVLLAENHLNLLKIIFKSLETCFIGDFQVRAWRKFVLLVPF